MLSNHLAYRTATLPLSRTLKKDRNVEADFSRLMHAAIVSKRFCMALLNDPLSAINAGYMGEHFSFSPIMREKIAAIKADSLSDFASQVLLITKKQSDKQRIKITL